MQAYGEKQCNGTHPNNKRGEELVGVAYRVEKDEAGDEVGPVSLNPRAYYCTKAAPPIPESYQCQNHTASGLELSHSPVPHKDGLFVALLPQHCLHHSERRGHLRHLLQRGDKPRRL